MQEIDKKIFIDSNNIINEDKFKNLFDYAYNLRITYSQFKLIDKYKNYFITPYETRIESKIYNNEKIKTSFDKFFDLFLKTFDGVEWSVSDRNDDFVVAQDLKRNNPEEYLNIMNKIKDLSHAGYTAYKEYRMIIKDILEI